MTRINILSCTDRHDSNALAIAKNIRSIYEEKQGDVELHSLVDFPLQDVVGGRYGDDVPSVKAFNSEVLSGDGLVMVIPEYNGGFPGILKMWIDYLPFPESFDQYPICLVGEAAGSFGALRPVEQIQDLVIYRNAYVYPRRVFIFRVDDRLNDEGELIDEKYWQRLENQADGFVNFVEKLSANQTAAGTADPRV